MGATLALGGSINSVKICSEYLFFFCASVREIFQSRILGGLPFPFPGDLPNPKIKSRSPALQVGSLPTESPGKPCF